MADIVEINRGDRARPTVLPPGMTVSPQCAQEAADCGPIWKWGAAGASTDNCHNAVNSGSVVPWTPNG